MPTTEEFNDVAFDVFNRLWEDNFAPHEWDFNDGTTLRVDDEDFRALDCYDVDQIGWNDPKKANYSNDQRKRIFNTCNDWFVEFVKNEHERQQGDGESDD